MKCPVDGETLVMADRSGVEIDYCPKCRGVWLDRGELDKIIERSAPQAAAPGREPVREVREVRHEDRRDERSYRDDHDRPRHKRRESFLSDLFDF